MIVLQSILFFILLFFLFYFPGRFLLRITGFSYLNASTTVSLSFSIGIAAFLIVMYFLSLVNLSLLYIIPLVVILIKEYPLTIREVKKVRFNRQSVASAVIIATGSMLMALLMWTSGQHTKHGDLLFYAVNAYDAIWHISLIGSLENNFPPMHPGLSEIPLRGYNFYYDFLLANIVILSGLSSLDVYFRLAPFPLAILFGLATLAFGKFLKLNNLGLAILLFLSYFGQGVGFFVVQFMHIPYESPIVQSAAHIVDPSVVLSLILFYAIYILLFVKKPSYLVTLCLAVLPMIKIYTALLVFVGLGCVALITVTKHREFVFAKILAISGILAAVLYLPTNFGAGSLIYAPFLLYKHYMEGGLVVPRYQWILKYQTYQAHSNYLRIIQLYIIAVFLYIVPSLGIRLISFLSIRNLFTKKFYSLQNIFLTVIICVGFLLPTFFIQSVAVFVVVQFLWIAYVLLLIPTAYTMQNMIKNQNPLKILLLSLALITLSLFDVLYLVKLYTQNPVVVRQEMVSMLEYARKTVASNKSLLVLNERWIDGKAFEMERTPIVSALSGKSVYYEPEVLEFLRLDDEVAARKARITRLLQMIKECNSDTVRSNFVKELQEVSAEYLMTMQSYSCLNTNPAVRKIHTSGALSLYEVKAE